MPANFRSYEGQLRLLTAVIAAHDIRLNYKAIADHYGKDWTTSGIEHFFRPIKKNGKDIKAMVKRGEDPANFVHNMFRAIRRDAADMRQSKGSSAGPSTPGSAASKNPKTPGTSGVRKRSAPSSKTTTTGKKTKLAPMVIDDDSSDGANVPPPVMKTPKINEEALRAYQTANYSNPGLSEAVPSLASANAASADDEEDTRVVTPGDAASGSFNNGSSQAYSAPAGSFSRPALGAAGMNSERYEPGPFYNPGGYGFSAQGVKNEDDDGAYDV